MRRSLPLLCGAVLAGLSGIATPFVGAQVTGGESRVLVLPFAASSGSGSEWMGRAVQQDLLADLTQGTTARIVAPSSFPAATDAEGALRAAREAGASIVVFGQAQTTGKEVRLTGEVVDVATATPLGAIKATGPADDLFHLEDALAGQIFVALPRTLLTAQTQQGIQQQQQQQTPTAVNPLSKQTDWPPAAVNPLSRPDSPVQQSVDAPPASVEVPPQPAAPSPVTPAPQPQQEPPYISQTVNPPAEAPMASAAPAPVVVDGGDAVAAPPPSYPVYNYDYYNTPVYDYSTPVYTYPSPGCYVWPGFTTGIYLGGGYGCYGGYGYHYWGGGHTVVIPHWNSGHTVIIPHYDNGYHHEWDHHGLGGEGDHHDYHDYHGGGHPSGGAGFQYVGAGNGAGHPGGATFAPVHGESRPGGFSRPSYLSGGGSHYSSGAIHGGSGSAGATHSYAGGSHGFSGGGFHSDGGGVHSAGGGGGSHGAGESSHAGGGGHHQH